MAPKRIGIMLKQLRDEKGLTQMELGKKAKVAHSYVALLEAGYRKNPSLAIVQRLAKALSVPVAELMQ